MCHETTDRPPPPPISGGSGAASAEGLTLQATDGNRLRAFAARAADPDAPGMLILPDVRGLHPFYEDLATRFAEAGVHATAIDYFGRTAGIDDRPDDFDFMSHVKQIRTEGLVADQAAGIANLGTGRTYTVGFCMGGRFSFNCAADHDVAGVIGFYGGPEGSGPDDPRAPIKLAPTYTGKVLGLFGGADDGIPKRTIDGFHRVLDEAGIENEMVSYPGAPHSFFDRKFNQHRDACEDAWRRVLAFVGRG